MNGRKGRERKVEGGRVRRGAKVCMFVYVQVDGHSGSEWAIRTAEANKGQTINRSLEGHHRRRQWASQKCATIEFYGHQKKHQSRH